MVFLARLGTRKSGQAKWFHICVIILISVIVIFSSIICGDGVYFIALVWETIDDPDESLLGHCVICHLSFGRGSVSCR